MPIDPKAKDQHDSGAPDTAGAPEGSVPRPDPGSKGGSGGPLGGNTKADEKRREVGGGDTSGGAPMDPQDEAFLKKSK